MEQLEDLALELMDRIIRDGRAIPDARTANVLASKVHEVVVLMRGYQGARPIAQRSFKPRL